MKIKWPGLTDGDKGRWVPRGEGEVNGSVGVKWAGGGCFNAMRIEKVFSFFLFFFFPLTAESINTFSIL